MRACFIIFPCVILCLITGCATLPGHYVSLHDQGATSFEEILHQIRNVKVIFVGEGHVIEEDHLVQLEIVRRLHESGKDVVIALEMFPAEMQPVLDQWTGGEISESDFKKVYSSVWTVPYGYYSKIFEYARQVGIPLAGINGNEALINDVAKNGLEKLPPDFREVLKVTSCAGASEYRRMIDLFGARVSHVSEMPFLCEAQLLRDSLMAQNIANILEGGGFTVVALVGSIHALRAAVPSILLKYPNVNSAVLMSRDFANILSSGSDAEIADYVWY